MHINQFKRRNNNAENEQSLMENANIAIYFAKGEGKNNYQFYSKDIKFQSIERLSIETNLRIQVFPARLK